ncbi:hypothetical protein Cgig2_025604 [Carnegiea gigantea]|uniref:Uncharacterized protein n=1 Tax=Carnegiea gigantea TaxID=171969 RepID=A0A9Q1Q765_9CARY|nr:hypothetical protein Cgig2_025604 [Carnegiea gigantea]
MSGREDDDSDAPEEFTAEQVCVSLSVESDEAYLEEVHREKKERRRKQAERLTPRPRAQSIAHEDDDEMVEDDAGDDVTGQSQVNSGMLPNDIVNLLAAREKQVFLSDSDEEKMDKKPKQKKKKINKSGVETVILNDLPPAPCVQTSLEFLQKRKLQVARSAAVLNNSNQALRLLSSSECDYYVFLYRQCAMDADNLRVLNQYLLVNGVHFHLENMEIAKFVLVTP